MGNLFSKYSWKQKEKIGFGEWYLKTFPTSPKTIMEAKQAKMVTKTNWKKELWRII